MNRIARAVFLLLIIVCVCSCASKTVHAPVHWPYQKEGIFLHIEADPELNLYHGASHTLVLCVHQLKDPNAFNQLSQDEKGLYELLECSSFSPSAVASNRFIVYPGKDIDMALDRAEGARYVGIVTGYYLLRREGTVKLYDVPWYVEEKGFWGGDDVARIGVLKVDLVLGPEQVKSFGGE